MKHHKPISKGSDTVHIFKIHFVILLFSYLAGSDGTEKKCSSGFVAVDLLHPTMPHLLYCCRRLGAIVANNGNQQKETLIFTVTATSNNLHTNTTGKDGAYRYSLSHLFPISRRNVEVPLLP